MHPATPPELRSVRQWTGRWIWVEGERKPFHFFLYARRSFDLAEAPAAARLRISASDRYALWVNGNYIARGPARSDPRRKSYDIHDVAAHLRPGANTIAVRAYHYATPRDGDGWSSWSGNAYGVGERAGLWAQLDIEDDDGATSTIGTDSAWRVRPAKAWDRTIKVIHSLVGPPEVFDAAADPPDWMQPDFDDGDWDAAWEVPTRDYDWVLLEARETALLDEREVFPARVSATGEVIEESRGAVRDLPERLVQEVHFPLEHAVIENVDALMGPDGVSELRSTFARGHGIRSPFIVLDFGRQLFGFPRVRLTAPAGAIVDMTYGQQLIDDRIPPGAPYGDRYLAREGAQVWEPAEYKQFRYLHLCVRSTYAPVHIESVSVDEYVYPAERRGAFECDDPLLGALWTACADTAYLNFEDTLVHEGFRERAIFNTGDGSHVMHMCFAAYGDLTLTDRFMRLVPLSNRGDGMLQMVYPPENAQRYVVANFLFQWSMRVREHYLHTGRRWVLEELYRSVPPQIDWYEPHRDADGLLRNLPLQNTLDWTANDLRGASFITNALYVGGLEDAAWLADRVGMPRDAERWRRIAADVRETLRRNFWDEDRGLFWDSDRATGPDGVYSDISNAYAILYGIAPPERVEAVARAIVEQYDDLVQATPLFFGYVADAILGVGLIDEGLDLIKRRYRPMLESTDNPMIWELWDPFTGGHRIVEDSDYAQRHDENYVRPMSTRSLAHTGGILVGYVLSTRVLGVTPTGPGFGTCRSAPRPGSLPRVEGTFPTPHGDIAVRWRRTADGQTLEVDVPRGVEAEVVLKRAVDLREALVYRDSETPLDAAEAVTAAGFVVTDAEVRTTVRTGTHAFELRVADNMPS